MSSYCLFVDKSCNIICISLLIESSVHKRQGIKKKQTYGIAQQSTAPTNKRSDYNDDTVEGTFKFAEMGTTKNFRFII